MPSGIANNDPRQQLKGLRAYRSPIAGSYEYYLPAGVDPMQVAAGKPNTHTVAVTVPPLRNNGILGPNYGLSRDAPATLYSSRQIADAVPHERIHQGQYVQPWKPWEDQVMDALSPAYTKHDLDKGDEDEDPAYAFSGTSANQQYLLHRKAWSPQTQAAYNNYIDLLYTMNGPSSVYVEAATDPRYQSEYVRYHPRPTVAPYPIPPGLRGPSGNATRWPADDFLGRPNPLD